MRVLVVSDFYPPTFWGGAELYAHGLAKALRRQGHTVEALTSSKRRFGHYDQDGIRVRFAPRPVAVLGPRLPPERWFRGYDVVHLHNVRNLVPGIFRRLRAAGVPVVWTLHDYWLMCPRINLTQPTGDPCLELAGQSCPSCLEAPLPKSRGWARFRPRAAHRDHETAVGGMDVVRRFIAPSRAMALQAERIGVAPDRIVTVHNAVEPRSARAMPEPGNVLLIGNHFGTYKGWPVALEAFRRLAAEGVGARLHIVGRGDLEAIRSRISQASMANVTVHGPVDDTTPFYERASIVILPSSWPENCSLVALEAMQYGRPLIATAIGGNPEVVKDGVTGRLFAPGDPVQLADELRRLLMDDERRTTMGANALHAARADFDLDEHARRVAKVYEEASA